MLVPTEVFGTFNFIGIDPGLNSCGLAIFKIEEYKLLSVEALTILPGKASIVSPYHPEIHSERIIKMNKLCLIIESLYRVYNPILVSCEAPFYNSSMPSAFGSLTETVTAIRTLTNSFNNEIPFVTYSPQEVKQAFKKSGKIGKLVMKDGLFETPELMSKIISNIETLDEHSIDAIAVGYTWYKNQDCWR